MKQFIQKYNKKCVAIALVVVLVLSCCLAFNYFNQGVWALPFDYRPVAVAKIVDSDTNEAKCYTIYANGDHAEVGDHECVDRDSNQIQWSSEDDLNRAHELNLIAPRYFRDDDTVFIVGMRDCGFGSSVMKVYSYDLPSRHLKYLDQFPTHTETDWIYAK